jgi:hypothetical protein
MVITVEQPAVPAPAGPPPLGRGRKIGIWALIVVASIVTLLSILTVWVDRQMLDNHSWHKASAKIIQDPAVQSALATELVNEMYANVDIAAELKKRLPKDFKQLADPAAAALRDPATRGVEFLLSQPRFQALFVQASDTAHEKLVNVLENKTGFGISTGNGVVTLDVSELLKQIGEALGIPTDALNRLPADVGQITIMSSDQLNTAQKAVRLIRILSVWLLVLVLVLYGAALYLARGRRRRTLVYVGWSLVVVGLLTLIAKRLIGNYVLSSLVSDTYREPAHHVWLIATAILGSIGWAVVMYGLILVLAAMLAGPWRAAVWVRREIAPVLNQHQDYAWGGVALLYLLVVLWGPTHALRTWWGILFIGLLLAVGIYLLRKQTLLEFPNAGLEPHEHTLGARMSAAAHKATDRVHRSHKEPAAAPAPARSTAEEIAWLLDLKEKGAITDDEFEQAKKHVLA